MCFFGRWVKREESAEADADSTLQDNTPKLDLGFKEGQTIKINIGVSLGILFTLI